MRKGSISVTVVRSGGRDEHGDPVPGTEHVIDKVVVAPRPGVEDDDKGETVIVGLQLFAPFEADILPTDRVRIDLPAWAGTYDVVGDPGRWQSPFTHRKPGMVVSLTRAGGS